VPEKFFTGNYRLPGHSLYSLHLHIPHWAVKSGICVVAFTRLSVVDVSTNLCLLCNLYSIPTNYYSARAPSRLHMPSLLHLRLAYRSWACLQGGSSLGGRRVAWCFRSYSTSLETPCDDVPFSSGYTKTATRCTGVKTLCAEEGKGLLPLLNVLRRAS